MSRLIVFAGPNGSGKSSLRDSVPIPVDVVIDPDRLARELNPANPKSMEGRGARKAVAMIDAAIASGQSLSIETTLTGHTAMQRMRRAKEAGYEVGLVYVGLQHRELNVLRVAERVARGGHGIDPDVVRKRVGTSLDNLPAALAFADQAVVLDNSGTVHRRIMSVADCRITSKADDMPQWLARKLPEIEATLSRELGQRAARGSVQAEVKGPSLMSTIFDALRRPEPTMPAPWAVAPIAMEDRIKTFEEIEAAKRAKPATRELDPEPEPSPRPSSGPKP